jgi:3-keto-L-gulonate-6-phosphate decarboxylase
MPVSQVQIQVHREVDLETVNNEWSKMGWGSKWVAYGSRSTIAGGPAEFVEKPGE